MCAVRLMLLVILFFLHPESKLALYLVAMKVILKVVEAAKMAHDLHRFVNLGENLPPCKRWEICKTILIKWI